MTAPLAPAVLVLAATPTPGAVKRALQPALGPHGCAQLQEVLVRRAVRWAEGVAPGRSFLALSPLPRGHGSPLRSDDLLADIKHTEVFAQAGGDLVVGLGAALGHVAEQHPGPLLCVSVDLPSLGDHHAVAAIADLDSGCDVVLGPSSDGGCYLLGLARPELGELEAALRGARRREILSRGLAVAQSDLAIGLLRSERELHTLADARTLLVDPTAPADVSELLAGVADLARTTGQDRGEVSP